MSVHAKEEDTMCNGNVCIVGDASYFEVEEICRIMTANYCDQILDDAETNKET